MACPGLDDRAESESGNVPPFVAPNLVDPEKLASLSGQEAAVLSLAAQGFLDKQISVHLGLSPNTLRTYWKRIRVKMGSGSRVELSSAYIKHQIASGVPLLGGEPAHWEVDLVRWKEVFYDRFLEELTGFPRGTEVDLETIISYFHPEDLPKMRSLLASIMNSHVPSFVFRARFVSPQGVGLTCAMVEVIRGESGRAERLRGRRIPFLDLTTVEASDVVVGHGTRDFRTGQIHLDRGFRSIYRIPPYAHDLRSAILSRYHPDDVELAGSNLDEMAARGETHRRRTFRLRADEERYQWVTADTHLSYEQARPVLAEVTVLAYS